SQGRGRRDNYRQGSKVEEQAPKALMEIDGVGWDWSYMIDDEEDHALVADKEAPIKFALMANISPESKVFDNSLRSKDCFFTSSKDLDNLIESQRSNKNKEGLGYSAVPPPPAQIYSFPKKDLSWTGLLQFADDTVTDYSRPSPTMETCLFWKPSQNLSNKGPNHNNVLVMFKKYTYIDTQGRLKCDNGGDFRNKEMNDFCSQKGIKRAFSNAQTPQQNGVAENRNRTLIDPRMREGLLSKIKPGFTVYQMDVKSAFLYGTIDKEVRQRGDYILVQVYVDDIIFGSSNPQLCREFEALMHEKFQMSAMGVLNFFLGLQVLQKEDGIFLSQDKYVRDILKKFRYSDVRSSNTPMDKENP
nr:putative ribonuclease H-like domain-containing protein [Tanacetum cinerariifolium]